MFICDEKATAQAVKLIKELTKLMDGDFRIQIDKYPFSLHYWVRNLKEDIAHFQLVQQANCCGILVSTDTWVKDNYQKMGVAQEMMKLKEALAKEFGFSCLLATVNMTGNPAEVHILEKFGWSCVSSFKNSRTTNKVGIFTKNL